MPRRTLATIVAALAMAACDSSAAPDALCRELDAIATNHDQLALGSGDDPEPSGVARAYRQLARHYTDAADALDDGDASASTSELASLYVDVADVLDVVSSDDGAAVEDELVRSEAYLALRDRMGDSGPLGFSHRAWIEIDDRCDVPIDPVAENPDTA